MSGRWAITDSSVKSSEEEVKGGSPCAAGIGDFLEVQTLIGAMKNSRCLVQLKGGAELLRENSEGWRVGRSLFRAKRGISKLGERPALRPVWGPGALVTRLR